MTDEQPTPNKAQDETPGWQVIGPDGNVVDSGPLTHAQAAFLAGEGDEPKEES